MFVHTLGAYFGLAVAFMARGRNVDRSAGLEVSRYTSGKKRDTEGGTGLRRVKSAPSPF